MKNHEEIKELANQRYGTDINRWGAQRDGFYEGYKQAQAEQLILSGVMHQRELLKKLNETGVFKNTEDQIEMILTIVNY